jgi:hypothetical protein
MEEVATSQPPPPTDGGAPWGSFYTASATGATPLPAKLPEKRLKGRAKRKRSAEPKPKGEKKLRRPRGPRTGRDGQPKPKDAAGPPKERRRSFSLRRESHTKEQETPAPAPVVAAAQSRRYAEPHVLVGVVGGTIIALYALAIALLYMIGNAA